MHIYAKTSKANKNGQLPIYFRLTVNGERFEFSTKKFIDKSRWSSEQSKMKGNSEEARLLNNYFDLIKSKLFDIQMNWVEKRQKRNSPLPKKSNLFINIIVLKVTSLYTAYQSDPL